MQFQILHNIFSPFPRSELLKFAGVSKTWKEIIKEIMASRKCYAHIARSCDDFIQLNALAGNQSMIFINGLCVKMPPHHQCALCIDPSEFAVRFRDLTSLKLQYLQFSVTSCLNLRKIIGHILLHACNFVQELHIDYSVSPLNKFKFCKACSSLIDVS